MNQTFKITLYLAAGALFCSASAFPFSKYLNKVYEFRPAPGQFINSNPEYTIGDTADDIADKCTELLANNSKGVISLGAWGGYIVFGFDHPVYNVTDTPDLRIIGNAFYATNNPNTTASKEGGSCEPGIVMVSVDTNGNGIPDDEWYQLAGSEYSNAATIHNYKITYYKPDANKTATPDPNDSAICDNTYIKWEDNQGNLGYVEKNTFHLQSYWPEWLDDNETLEFEGTRLLDNMVNEGTEEAPNYILYAYPWGYVDNHPNTDSRCNFDIDWAVDINGKKVYLPFINFVKVYTAVNQTTGWLGETSTEVSGAEDLNPSAGIANVNSAEPQIHWHHNLLHFSGFPIGSEVLIYNLSGSLVSTYKISSEFDCEYRPNLPLGVYIVKVNDKTLKIKNLQ